MKGLGSRAVAAFLVAPLAGTLMFTVLYLGLDTRGKVSGAPLWFLLLYMPFSLLVAYPAAWAVGVPSYLLWRRRPRKPGLLVAVHALAGAALLGLAVSWRSTVFWPLTQWVVVGGVSGAATGATLEAIVSAPGERDANVSAMERTALGCLTAPAAAAIAFWLIAFPPFADEHPAFVMLPWFVLPSYILTTVVGAVAYPVLRLFRALRPLPVTLVFAVAGLLLGLGLQYLERSRDDAPPYLQAALLAGVAAGLVFARTMTPRPEPAVDPTPSE